ncbi:MAG: ABC transporter substrate-binding protein [Sporichthyaceae bacterium]
MRSLRSPQRALAAIPLGVGVALLISACGSGGTAQVAAPAPSPAVAPAAPDASTQKLVEAVVKYLDAQNKRKEFAGDDLARPALEKAIAAVEAANRAQPEAAAKAAEAVEKRTPTVSASPSAVRSTGGGLREDESKKRESEARAEATGGATDTGVTKNSIKTGTIMMHGMALARLTTAPQIAGQRAALAALNDRGGVLGRRIDMVDCDDGPGEVSRTKSCLKKLVAQDRIFSLLTVGSWGSASIHDDLAQYRLPLVGAWAYSQTEWQDPYMFPTHMSMIHEAMAGANWVRTVIKPKTYGLICLTSPEMQLACNQVRKILDGSGAKMVKKADVPISETSMSGYVLGMRAANPDHIVHYVINPATIVKFLVESSQQGYYPPKGVSGNHVASEVAGSLIGDWPAGRYWTNTTYKLWGTEFMATMNKYATSSRGSFHHIVQAGYVGVNLFAQAAKQVGPNLTRERLMAALGNGAVWQTDASLDQKFSYTKAERTGSYENQTWDKGMAQGREFMYQYHNANTVSNPDGSPSGWRPDPTRFVIHTDR